MLNIVKLLIDTHGRKTTRLKVKCVRFVGRFRLNLRAYDASAKGVSENYLVLRTEAAYAITLIRRLYTSTWGR